MGKKKIEKELVKEQTDMAEELVKEQTEELEKVLDEKEQILVEFYDFYKNELQGKVNCTGEQGRRIFDFSNKFYGRNDRYRNCGVCVSGKFNALMREYKKRFDETKNK